MGQYSKGSSKRSKELEQHTPRETVSEVLTYPTAYLPNRGIRKEIYEKFGVKMTVSESDGKTPTAIYFPYHNKEGKVVGFKKRDLTKDKYEKWHFSTVGKVSVDCKLFGQQYAETIERKRSQLIYAEGEFDHLSVFQACVDSVAGTAHQGIEPFVVGLSCGTGNAQDATMHNIDFIKSFGKIVLGFDNDSATDKEKAKKIRKGREATEDVAAVIMQDNIFTVDYLGFKDPNEMLVAGKSKQLSKAVTWDSKKFVAEKVLSASDISLDFLTEKRIEGVYVNSFPKLMDKIHGFRKNELVVLTAPSNVGKSYVTAEFGYSFLTSGKRVGFMMFEETSKETVQRMLARRLKVNYNYFKDDPLSCCSEDQIKDAYEWLKEDDKMFILDHFGSMQIDELLNKIKSFVYINKVDYIILDHLSMLISGSRVSDERKEMDICMTELAAFCAANEVGIIAVSHLNRSIAQDFKPAKGKEDEPFWVPVTKESMRSSAALEQLSWIVLGLEPQIMPDKSRGDVRLTVLKNRPWSYLGVADQFYMDDKTGELILRGQDVFNTDNGNLTF